jgi:hypothetical protein
MPEAVKRQDVEAGQRRGQSRDQRVARGLPRATRPNDQRHPFRIRPTFHEQSEPFAKRRGLPGAGRTGYQERTAPVCEDGLL